MTFRGVGERLPIARRRISPIWLIVGAISLLALCCCSGLLIHSVGFDAVTGGKGSPTPEGGSSSGALAAPLEPAGTPVPTTAPGPHAVPSVIGLRLPDAERRLKAAGFSKMHVTDVTGKGRIVIDPTNWVVRIQEPAPGRRVTGATRITLRVGKPTDLLTTAPAITGLVPNVVCRDLQTAQDTLRDAGYYVLTSKDGTGHGRHQILDRNWVVIAQSAAAGTRPRLSTRITLTAVKFGEPTTRCPT